LPLIVSPWGNLGSDILEQIRGSETPVRVQVGEGGRIVVIDPATIVGAVPDRLPLGLNVVPNNTARPGGTPLQNISIAPIADGEFGLEIGFVITAEQLAEAKISLDAVRVFRVSGNTVVSGGRVIARNGDGSVTIGVTCGSTYVIVGATRIGDVLGTGGPPIVNDALQILRSLVGLSNSITGNPFAIEASNIIAPGATTMPTVQDALQILRYLVGLPSNLDAVWRAGA
jgi:hypothetical protein